jgi:hypothetical protein
MGVMDDSESRESTDHKWDPYQKHCIKLVTKLPGLFREAEYAAVFQYPLQDIKKPPRF